MATRKETEAGTLKKMQLPSGFLRQLPPAADHILMSFQAVESPIHIVFERILSRFENKLALQDEHGSLTFRELEGLANRIARALLTAFDESRNTWKPVGNEDAAQTPVALLLGHDINTIAAMLAVMKAGGFFINLEPLQPTERLRFMVNDSNAPVLITSDEYLDIAQDLASGNEISVINVVDWIKDESIERVSQPVALDALCSLIYTSGSTGRPKGVKRSHRDQMLAVWQDNQHYQVTANDRYAILDSIGAGGTITHAFAFLFGGGSVHLYNLKRDGLEVLYGWLLQHKITCTTAATTLFRYICQVFSQNLTSKPDDTLIRPADKNGIFLPDFRFFITGGEPVRPGDIQLFQDVFPPHAYLRVGGGSTEAQWIAESFVNRQTVTGDFGVPWGYIAKKKEILIWDEDGKPVPEGQIGEIVVKSHYLSPGYWRRPELDQKVFLPDPDGGLERLYRTGDLGSLLPNDMLVHHGRLGHMIKVRGFRVELTEIESVLLEMPAIKEALVQPRKNKAGDVSLTAYIVLQDGQRPVVNDIRHFLMDRLPDYMVPASYIFLDAFPLTVNNKVDRANLPEPPSIRPDLGFPFTAPRTPIETEIAAIWSEVLGIEPIGVHDPFLELGGDSLLAMRVINTIGTKYRGTFKLSALLEEGTVEGLAKFVEHVLNQEEA